MPGAFLPVLAGRVSEVESDCPFETPAEENEADSESLKHEGLLAGRGNVRRKSGAEFGQVLTVSKQSSYCYASSGSSCVVRNGFRACRLC
jgi:hypothetical protein